MNVQRLAALRGGLRWTGAVLLAVVLAAGLSACTLPTSGEPDEETVTISGPPVVEIAAPLPNASYLEGVPVVIQVAVSNAGADISRVEFSVDGTAIASQVSPNAAGASIFSLTQTWPAAGVGPHTISVSAFREGGESDSASVTVNVVDPASQPTDPPASPTAATGGGDGGSAPDPTATTEPEPTDPPPPTEEPAEPTPSVPIARTTQGINVRSGPGLNFEPPITVFAANTEVEIIAVNPARTWLKVAYGVSGEGWIFAGLAEVEGNLESVPVDIGPPTPIPATPVPTPVPATPTPPVQNNLVVTQPFIDPPLPVCGQPFRVGMTIRNDGTSATTTGLSRIEIQRASDGTIFRSSDAALVPVTLQPGGTHSVAFDFTVDVFINETHRVVFIADVNNQVAETNENDNRVTVDYPFGDCP